MSLRKLTNHRPWRKFQNLLPRTTIITIYITFVRSSLNYGDILYDQAFHNSLHDRPESVRRNAYLAITGAIRGTSRRITLRIGFGTPYTSTLI